MIGPFISVPMTYLLRRFRENETELQNMAKVYAYLEVSITRISD